jgi:hypothetical protein
MKDPQQAVFLESRGLPDETPDELQGPWPGSRPQMIVRRDVFHREDEHASLQDT